MQALTIAVLVALSVATVSGGYLYKPYGDYDGQGLDIGGAALSGEYAGPYKVTGSFYGPSSLSGPHFKHAKVSGPTIGHAKVYGPKVAHAYIKGPVNGGAKVSGPVFGGVKYVDNPAVTGAGHGGYWGHEYGYH